MYFEIGLAIAVVIGAGSVLLVALALSTHFVFRPLLIELVERSRGNGKRLDPSAEARLAAVEAELLELGSTLERVRDARDFERQLAEGRGS